MRVLLVPSSVSPEHCADMQFLSTYLINDTVAIDAGCLGYYGTPADQARVKHLFLTHSHMDHVASLPMFLDNTYTGDGKCVTVYGSEGVLECLRTDLFNDRLWPDFLRISRERPPYLRLHTLQPREPITVDGLEVTPIPVHHSVPTFGYLVSDGRSTIVVPSDTGPTTEIWDRANASANLSTIFLECSVSNEKGWLAELAKHLTPNLLAEEIQKVRRRVRWVVVHIQPRCRDEVLEELGDLNLAGVEIARFGSPYDC